MFKAILKLIFPSIKGKKKPNYLYFEKDKVTEEEVQQAVKKVDTVKPLRLAILEETHRQEFYDFLFSQ
jgi:hypothetical protein